MLPFKQFNGDLMSDLQRLGLSASTTNALSESRISEGTYAPLSESREEAPALEADEMTVAESTLDRIEALINTDSLSAEDAETILDGLSTVAPTGETSAQFESIVSALSMIGAQEESAEEGSIEDALVTIAEALEAGEVSAFEAFRIVAALADAPIEEGNESLRDEIIEAIVLDEGFRKMLKKIGGVFKKVKVKKMTSAEKAKSRAQYRKTKAKRKMQRRKRMKTAAFKKGQKLLKKAQDRFGMGESSDLANRLSSRLNESTADEFGMIARIGRIFNLLSEHVSDDVIEIMEEHYNVLATGLFESDSDLEAACRPCIAIIAECLKDIEQGNC
jgi:hypothetical protein